MLLALAFSWAVVQFPMVGAAGFATLVACRVLLGAGEGPAFSVAVHALYKWFPEQQRTIPTAVLTQGAAVGVIVALPALNWIVVRYSWHWAFFALGAGWVFGLTAVVATAILPFHFLGNQLEDWKQTAPPHLGVGFFRVGNSGISEEGVSTSMDCGGGPYPRLSSLVAARIRADAKRSYRPRADVRYKPPR